MDLRANPGGVVAYCETRAEHPDNERFLRDCEKWWGVEVVRLRSDEYADTWDVWERRKYIAGVDGAPCTGILKAEPRHGFQRPDDVHVFGYTCDAGDAARAKRLAETFFELRVEFPLVVAGVNKAACLSIVEAAGVALPVMYGLGFAHNNCIPCGKATSPAYWAAVRLHFPDRFGRMAELSRRLGARLARLRGERVFIDEIPADWPTASPEVPACDFLCQLAAQGLVP
ncbi:MAG: hypothetical protein ACREFP_24615 [Acetobacteraceae bacterium]